MRRFRLSTLMLLIVIAALVVALVMQYRREARLRIELERKEYDLETARNYVHKRFNEILEQKLRDAEAGQRK
jgi:hypothetical protein